MSLRTKIRVFARETRDVTMGIVLGAAMVAIFVAGCALGALAAAVCCN
jgi:hypothetical protein